MSEPFPLPRVTTPQLREQLETTIAEALAVFPEEDGLTSWIDPALHAEFVQKVWGVVSAVLDSADERAEERRRERFEERMSKGRSEMVIEEAERRTGLDRDTIWQATDAMFSADLFERMDIGVPLRAELVLAEALEQIVQRGFRLVRGSEDA